MFASPVAPYFFASTPRISWNLQLLASLEILTLTLRDAQLHVPSSNGPPLPPSSRGQPAATLTSSTAFSMPNNYPIKAIMKPSLYQRLQRSPPRLIVKPGDRLLVRGLDPAMLRRNK